MPSLPNLGIFGDMTVASLSFATVGTFVQICYPGCASQILPPPGLELVPVIPFCVNLVAKSFYGLNSVWDRQLHSLSTYKCSSFQILNFENLFKPKFSTLELSMSLAFGFGFSPPLLPPWNFWWDWVQGLRGLKDLFFYVVPCKSYFPVLLDLLGQETESCLYVTWESCPILIRKQTEAVM